MTRAGAWSETDIPDQRGRTVLVTGANSGLGLRTASVLARKGATVLLACRSPERGERARQEVAAAAHAEPVLVSLDLADLASVRAAAATVRERTGDALDVLINNGGVMASLRGTTADGFETHFGTNYLGHAALTWLLMPALRGGTASRVVTVSSLSAGGARLDLDDPNYEHKRFNAPAAYARSKLANHVFALELGRRLRETGDNDIISVAAHPGYTTTGLVPGLGRTYRNPLGRALASGIASVAGVFGQPPATGALPQLRAATAPDVADGDYFGPRAVFQLRGHPTPAKPPRAALDPALGPALWELTAKLTQITPDPA